MRFLAPLAALLLTATAQAQTPPVSTAPVPKGTYAVDKAHTSILFRVSHVGFSQYTGRFTRFEAQLDTDPANLAGSKVSVTIDPKSIEADNAPAGFMAILAGKDWLDAEKFPEMKFVSNKVEVNGKKLRIWGDFTLHGVTHPLVLEANYNGGYAGHQFEPRARIGFSAQGSFKRSDFGVSMGVPAPGSTFGVGDEVSITIESEWSGPPLTKSNEK